MAQRQLLKREEELEINELSENEKFVYDSRNQVTHFLNSTTALVWDMCNGKNNQLELENIVRLELNISQADVTVQTALSELSKFNLLQ